MTAHVTKPIILVDGSSYLYRAFHALPALMNSKNFPTGAVYGVIAMLRKLMSDYHPQHMAVVFDAKGKTFRDDLFPAYKAHRKAMPEELIQQIEPIHAIIKAMGLPILMIEGVEADDVIGTLAKQAAQNGDEVLISTGDKDLAQLVDERITLVNTMTNTFLNPQTVQEKFGVPPEKIIDYLTLVGDTSDNIPGVPQVGPKTAVKWLQQYGSLENVMANATSISGKVGASLCAVLSQIPLSKSLVTIKQDVALPLAANDLKLLPANQELLIHWFKDLEFKNWLAALLETKVQENIPQEKYAGYEIIYTEEHLNKWHALLNQAAYFSFNIESTSIDPFSTQIVGVSFAIAAGKAVYIPFGQEKQLTHEQVLKNLTPVLENTQLNKIGHNIKANIEILAANRITLRGNAYDTILESYILDSISTNPELDNLALKYLGRRIIPLEEIAGKGIKQISFKDIPTEKLAIYAAERADVILQLHHLLWPRLDIIAGLKFVFEKIEMPLVAVLARIERNGVLIDASKMRQQSKELTQRLHELEQQAYTLAGKPFNINSPKQLQQVLFEELNIPVLQKTPTGQPSTAEPVLQELALDYPLPHIIIECRGLSKLISTYTNKLPEQINPLTGRIHTSYNQTGAATGRLSSSNPNLQNIPIKTQEGRRIRQAFIAAPGYKIVSADYSQIELRLMAHISKDPGLVAAFMRDLDIHQATAAEVLGVALSEVTEEARRAAKAVNFGLIYGMSAFGLSKQLKIDRYAAQRYIDRYFARYPQVKAYMENTRLLAREQGYVETLWGRRLYLPDINSSQGLRQKAAERAAINAPLQGSAADIIKMAMICLDEELQKNKLDAKIIMQVHDELVLEVAESALATVMDAVKLHMTQVVSLDVPITVSMGYGDNWDEASL